MSGNVIHIAYATNDRMAMPAAVSLASAIDCLVESSAVVAHVLVNGLSADCRRRLQRVVASRTTSSREHQLVFHEITPHSIRDLVATGRFSIEAYFRLLLPTVLGEVERVVYLDADTVVGCDLSPLATMPLGGHPAAGVSPPDSPTLGSASGIEYCCEQLGIDGDLPLINSGVMVLDLDAFRRESIQEKTLEFARQFAEELMWVDQDALNAVLANRWKQLDNKWNLIPPCVGGDCLAMQHPDGTRPDIGDCSPESIEAILHFTGAHKPWGAPALRHPQQRWYYNRLLRSGWFDSRFEAGCWRAGWYMRNIKAAAFNPLANHAREKA